MKKFISKLISVVLLCTILTYTTPIFAFTKDETVYSKLDSNGKVYDTIVSDHITNAEQNSLINDISDLLNIRNISGDETFEQNGNTVIWHSNGDDIYYQGETDKKLPIQCEIKYELNGEEISSDDIAGKSGKVKITLTYTNSDSHIVNINGKNVTMYTPFVVLCGAIIDNDNNRNIEISKGKVIDDGSKTTVIGLSLPGLQESLGIKESVVKIPNTVEITMDTTNFEMGNIMTYVSSKVLEDEDLNLFDNIDKIYSQVNTLQSASKQLESGSTLLKNSSYSLQAGAKTISEGTSAISENLTILNEKMGDLQAGASALKVGKDNLSAGISTFMSSVNVSDFTDQSTKIAELQQLITANTTVRDTLVSTNASLNNKLSLGGLTAEEETTIRTQIASNTNLISLLNSNISANNSTLTLLRASDISSISQLQSGLVSLQSGLQAFDFGIDSLYTGVEQLQEGTHVLASKSVELSQGANALYKGTKDLSSGAETLASGMSTFNKDGIGKICNYFNGDLKQLSSRLEKLEELSEDYNNFTMINDGDSGSVKFIMIVDSVKNDNSKKQEILIEDKNGEKDE